MGMEDDLTLGGGHTIQCTDFVCLFISLFILRIFMRFFVSQTDDNCQQAQSQWTEKMLFTLEHPASLSFGFSQ